MKEWERDERRKRPKAVATGGGCQWVVVSLVRTIVGDGDDKWEK